MDVTPIYPADLGNTAGYELDILACADTASMGAGEIMVYLYDAAGQPISQSPLYEFEEGHSRAFVTTDSAGSAGARPFRVTGELAQRTHRVEVYAREAEKRDPRWVSANTELPKCDGLRESTLRVWQTFDNSGSARIHGQGCFARGPGETDDLRIEGVEWGDFDGRGEVLWENRASYAEEWIYMYQDTRYVIDRDGNRSELPLDLERIEMWTGDRLLNQFSVCRYSSDVHALSPNGELCPTPCLCENLDSGLVSAAEVACHPQELDTLYGQLERPNQWERDGERTCMQRVPAEP